MAIAINPVLVMGLVGSLIYFLLEVLYQGAYPDRLQFCLTMFIFAIVLISRIAMEEGFEHAAPFGLALAVVVALALNRFVDYGQGALRHFGWLINWGLMALTWWCAHQLTWDSTIIDDSEEVESQGLLETVGIDKATGQPVPEELSAADNTADAAAVSGGRRGRVLAGWEQILNRKGRPHAPGVWVVYFSLASLPIFGIGQLLIPAANKPSRRVCVRTAVRVCRLRTGPAVDHQLSGAAPLSARRRLEMPPIMAGTWLVTGATLIVGLLLLVALLPRPNPEYAISELPLRFSSQELSSSKLAPGQEGSKDPQAQTGSGVDHARDPAERDNPTEGAGKQPAPGGQGSSTAAGKGEKQGSSGKGQEKGGKGSGPPGKSPTEQSKRNDQAARQTSDRDALKPPPSVPDKNRSSQSPPTPSPSVALAVGGFLARYLNGSCMRWRSARSAILAGNRGSNCWRSCGIGSSSCENFGTRYSARPRKRLALRSRQSHCRNNDTCDSATSSIRSTRARPVNIRRAS